MKTNNNKYRSAVTALFLSAYCALLIFNVFHIHEISLLKQTSYNAAGNTSETGSADYVNLGSFTCQYSLVYNSSFIVFTYSAAPVSEYFEELISNKSLEIPVLKDHFRSLPLRAPPVIS